MADTPRVRGSTRRSVRAGDTLAGAVITVGGLGVLAIMLGICVFLVASAAPLFMPARADTEPARGEAGERATSMRIVEGGEQAVVFRESGIAEGVSLAAGGVWGRVSLAGDDTDARVFVDDAGDQFTVVSSDGTVVTGSVGCDARPLDAASVPEGIALSDIGVVTPMAGGADADDSASAIEHTEFGWRAWELRVTRDPGVRVRGDAPIELVDAVRVSERERVIVTVHADGTMRRAAVRSVPRLDGRGSRDRTSRQELVGVFDPEAGLPTWVRQVANASVIVAVWDDGRCAWFDADDEITAGGEGSVSAPGESVSAVSRAVGANTVLIGDSAGRVGAWTPVRADGTLSMVRTSVSDLGDGAVVSVAPGARHRSVAVGLAGGEVSVYDPTSGKHLAHWAGHGDAGVVAVSPGLGRVAALGEGGAYRVWSLDPGHPSSTWKSLFGRVHYEGYDEAAFVYQSTGAPGTQPKLSLMPLIWGTLKATVVAMLFAVPLAVLAATYTSESLHPAWRKTVKPAIELMASLPSVVLGFLAAMVAAPLVRDWLPGILVGFGVIPVTVMVGAGVWRMLPRRVTRRTPTWALALLIGATLSVGVGLSWALGAAVESTLFARPDGTAEIRAWLDGNYGGAWPGWMLLLTLPAIIGVTVLWVWAMSTRWNAWMDGMPRAAAGLAELGLLAGQIAAALGIAAAGAWGLSAVGLDTRDSVFGPFNQRNTLVVGLIMGVAVIPIIYTISEDALRAVPRSLRFASLGCGATPWQTTVRVVLPVAASGIFSACMIGLGRAVGETMIVLMATGNTPEMTMNIFSGFRTLAANIAVELPEAPRESTHYHVLFLCGLVLFVMTLAINSTAELVRQHFRKRNAAL